MQVIVMVTFRNEWALLNECSSMEIRLCVCVWTRSLCIYRSCCQSAARTLALTGLKRLLFSNLISFKKTYCSVLVQQTGWHDHPSTVLSSWAKFKTPWLKSNNPFGYCLWRHWSGCSLAVLSNTKSVFMPAFASHQKPNNAIPRFLPSTQALFQVHF